MLANSIIRGYLYHIRSCYINTIVWVDVHMKIVHVLCIECSDSRFSLSKLFRVSPSYTKTNDRILSNLICYPKGTFF